MQAPKILEEAGAATKKLCALVHESLTNYLRTPLTCANGVPGIIMTLHTFGEYRDFHPHSHALGTDGLLLRNPTNSLFDARLRLWDHPSHDD